MKDNATSGYSDALMLFEHLVWGILFFFMLFNVASFDFLSQFLKYTVVGFFVFLLVFEGGTTKYVIQFLPYLLILGGIGLY